MVFKIIITRQVSLKECYKKYPVHIPSFPFISLRLWQTISIFRALNYFMIVYIKKTKMLV